MLKERVSHWTPALPAAQPVAKRLTQALLHVDQRQSSQRAQGQEYLLGLRGILVLQCFVWVFLHTLAPAAVKDSNTPDGPAFQVALRKTLSVIFWNESLLYAFFIILSARSLAIPFLHEPRRSVIASAIFRRGLRLWWPVSVSLAIITLIYSRLGFDYLNDFRSGTSTTTLETPYFLRNALIYFNSAFNLFWVNKTFAAQAGSRAFPTQTLWIVNVIYMQSYTAYMALIVVPYTRASWRIKAALAFIITAWWVQSWAWYTISGLLMADAVANMDFKRRSATGLPLVGKIRLPSWTVYVALILGGLAMQYLWVDVRPDLAQAEVTIHASLYTNDQLNWAADPAQSQARDDTFLIVLGTLLLVETYDWLQKLLRTPFLVRLGHRSLSWFLTQSIIIYTLGIKMYLALAAHSSLSATSIVGVCFLVCLATTIVIAECFYRLVDYPADAAAKYLFDWIRA